MTTKQPVANPSNTLAERLNISPARLDLLKRLSFHAVLLIIGFVVVFPIIWSFSQSITPETAIWNWPPRVIPENPTMENYQKLFTRQDLQMTRWFFNSLFVSVVTTALVLFVTSMAAYSFARLRFPGRDI